METGAGARVWPLLKMVVPSRLVEVVSEALSDAGAISTSIEDAEARLWLDGEQDEPGLWRQNLLTALLAPGSDAVALMRAIEIRLGAPLPYRLTTLADRQWDTAWQELCAPLCFRGRLCICPSGFSSPAGAAIVYIDPGAAFGTGAHPSTALCLDWLAEQASACANVLDYGCGSGVLAIAALKLGAQRAWGVDEEARALAVSTANAERNGVAQRYRALAPGALPPGLRVDILLANILARPLIELAPRLLGLLRPGAALVLSGILAEQVDSVSRHYAPLVDPQTRYRLDERGQRWALLAGRTPDRG